MSRIARGIRYTHRAWADRSQGIVFQDIFRSTLRVSYWVFLQSCLIQDDRRSILCCDSLDDPGDSGLYRRREGIAKKVYRHTETGKRLKSATKLAIANSVIIDCQWVRAQLSTPAMSGDLEAKRSKSQARSDPLPAYWGAGTSTRRSNNGIPYLPLLKGIHCSSCREIKATKSPPEIVGLAGPSVDWYSPTSCLHC